MTVVISAMVMANAGSANAHYVPSPAKQVKHGTDVLRFFDNHPHLARTKAGKVAIKNHSWLRDTGYARFTPRDAICWVFGSYCGQALAVSYCETGGTYSVYAANGQYLGLFQMGSHERATYGHGYTAYAQSRAAYLYFAASGYDWSPWECKP